MKLSDLKAKDLSAVSDVYLSGGGAMFLVRDEPPKWPEECVVCGKYCAETAEFFSRRTLRFGNLQWTVKSRSFMVPVHLTGKSCLPRLRNPVPLWVWLVATLAALAAGGFMSHMAHPVAADRLGAFIVFGAVAFCLALVPVMFSYSPSLQINEGQDGWYYAGFKDKDYARRFAALNPAPSNPATTRATK